MLTGGWYSAELIWLEGEETRGNEIEGYVEAEIAAHKMRLCIFPDDADGVAGIVSEMCEKQQQQHIYLYSRL